MSEHTSLVRALERHRAIKMQYLPQCGFQGTERVEMALPDPFRVVAGDAASIAEAVENAAAQLLEDE